MVLKIHAVDHNLRIGAGCDNGLVVDHYPDTGFASKQERHQEVSCSSRKPDIFCRFVDTLSRTDSMLDTLVLYTVTTGEYACLTLGGVETNSHHRLAHQVTFISPSVIFGC